MTIDRLAILRDEHSDAEYALLREALVESDWSQLEAAYSLGCSPSTLSRAIHRHPKLRASLEKRGLTRNRAQ